MVLSTAALIGAGVAAAAGAAGGAINRKKGRDRQSAYYDYAEDLLNSQYYEDPFSTIGGRALIKGAKQNAADAQDAINNRMVAGGATFENALAARQANNENLDKVGIQLLQADDVRRRGVQRDMLSLAGQRANAESSAYYQAAQDWNQWGSQTANAFMSLGSTGLLGGSGAAGKWGSMADEDVLGGMGVAAKGLAREDMMQPIIGGAPSLDTPGVTVPLGGLRGVKR